MLWNQDLPYLKDGIRILEEKVNKIRNDNYKRDERFTWILREVFGNFFSKETTEPRRKISYIILNAE